MQISLLDPLDLCLLCLSTAAQSWISCQDQVCTIDPVAKVTSPFQLPFLHFMFFIKTFILANILTNTPLLVHNDLDNNVYYYD